MRSKAPLLFGVPRESSVWAFPIRHQPSPLYSSQGKCDWPGRTIDLRSSRGASKRRAGPTQSHNFLKATVNGLSCFVELVGEHHETSCIILKLLTQPQHSLRSGRNCSVCTRWTHWVTGSSPNFLMMSWRVHFVANTRPLRLKEDASLVWKAGDRWPGCAEIHDVMLISMLSATNSITSARMPLRPLSNMSYPGATVWSCSDSRAPTLRYFGDFTIPEDERLVFNHDHASPKCWLEDAY